VVLMLATASTLLIHSVAPAPHGQVVQAQVATRSSVIPVDPRLLGPTAPPTPAPLAVDWLGQHGQASLSIDSQSAILVDADTKEVVWARDERSRRPPASLTKMVTAMVAADLVSSFEQPITVPVEATTLESDSTFMGLSPGEVVTVRDLMYGMFLVSGNDAAETLARGLVTRERFVQLMNDKAAALGMRDTHFTNPSGLDDPDLHTTAYDVAIAATTIATRYPAIMAVAGVKDQLLPGTPEHKTFFFHTLTKLIGTYPGATGLKTGYTDDAGYCLVGTATRGDRRLVVVLLGGDFGLTADAVKLLDHGFSQPRPLPFDSSTIPNV
jgi:serine-type D-Ala-D-Ala carboxypeptidase (penicillin-binding protein 5/6)